MEYSPGFDQSSVELQTLTVTKKATGQSVLVPLSAQGAPNERNRFHQHFIRPVASIARPNVILAKDRCH